MTPAVDDAAVEATARLLERALALPLPLTEPLVEGEHELLGGAPGEPIATGWVATFDRSHESTLEEREAALDQAFAWCRWLADRFARRWGPWTERTPDAWRLLEQPLRFREATNVAQLCRNQSLSDFAAWRRGSRWFGAAVLESDRDTACYVFVFVGRLGAEDAPPGPPPLVVASARPYRADATFAAGDLLDHPRFGRGTVRAAAGRAIDIEFAEGTKRLAHRPRQT